MTIEPWELILHHSYTGTPGVIFDQSPGRRHHGQGVNLLATDFLADGAEKNSGAIAFRTGTGVKVEAAEPWSPKGVRLEVVCRVDSSGGGTVIDAGGFWLQVGPLGAVKLGTRHSTYPPPFPPSLGGIQTDYNIFPFGKWVKLGLFWDGVGASQLTFDDALAADFGAGPGPMDGVGDIFIAGLLASGPSWTGDIDDVKLWRLNPHWVDHTFTNRPAGPATRDCWWRWSKALGTALAEDTECAVHVAQLVRDAVASISSRAASNPSTAAMWEQAADEYQRRWPTGDLYQVGAVLVDLVGQVGSDLQLKTDPAITALVNDPCVSKIAAKLPALDCDKPFLDMLYSTAEQIRALP